MQRADKGTNKKSYQNLNDYITQFVNGTKWVVSKYSHRFSGDGTFTTVVECFTPYINREMDANHTAAERQVQKGNATSVEIARINATH